jgi:peptidyl-tRNA hydrolase, PTH1 family
MLPPCMKLIVGLGNPGRKYQNTRHNVGFEVLNLVAEGHSGGTAKEKFEGRVAEVAVANRRALLLWPYTLMNRSGSSVGAAVEFYKLALDDVLIVADDFNLPLGKLRFRSEGSAGGQKGLADIIRRLGSEEISRLRIGIGPVPEAWDAADFVLGKFTAAERKEIDEAIGRAADGVERWAADGIGRAMNQFN